MLSEAIWAKLPVGNTPNDDELRNEYWRCIDVNSNGYLSLAEIDKGLRDVIKLPEIFALKPVIIRAFNVAKTSLKAKSKYGDDYVSKAEFKFLLIYLRQYYEYWKAFELIDMSKDRRVSEAELKAAAPILAKNGIEIQDPKAVFKEVDTNNGGYILFD
jgi:hypothetical protein